MEGYLGAGENGVVWNELGENITQHWGDLVLGPIASLLLVLIPVSASKEVLANNMPWKVGFDINEEM
jgi:hypothetical protein